MSPTLFPGASIESTDNYFLVWNLQPTPLVANTSLFSAGNKIALMGPIWFPSGSGTKSITRVGFKWGTVTKASGSGVRVSLQDIDNTGSTLRPDGTQDQFIDIANGDSGLVADTWYRTGVLSGSRSVQCGDMIAVVLEWDGAGRLGTDVIGFQSLIGAIGSGGSQTVGISVFTAAWSGPTSGSPNVVFEFSDGTFGKIASGGAPYSALGFLTYASDTAIADEYALEFAFADPVAIDGVVWVMQAGGGGMDLVLYQGTTVVATASLNGNHIIDTANQYITMALFSSSIDLTPNILYRLAVKPTSTTPIILPYLDVANADHWTLHFGGKLWRMNSRLDGGAWNGAVATRRPYIFPLIAGWQ